jgi:hypothetical protein
MAGRAACLTLNCDRLSGWSPCFRARLAHRRPRKDQTGGDSLWQAGGTIQLLCSALSVPSGGRRRQSSVSGAVLAAGLVSEPVPHKSPQMRPLLPAFTFTSGGYR